MTQILNTCDPKSYTNAKMKPRWEQAMQHEMDYLEKNHTWYLVPWPQGKNIVKFRWVYQTKFTLEGVVEHQKAHFVAKRFSQ